ncbi:MAG TPA: glycine zipper 2TM domain-containing protein [Burkholderiales bacterium]|nr:glycine zipper 2TM domain-containing protein [Burkholderiales bacterium]
MHTRPGLFRTLTLIALVGGALAVAVPLNSYGDPPPWAPAHGKRKKGDAYTGYTGKKWDKHYGVVNGRCNREAVGAVIGAAAGGAIGSQVGRGENRPIAILVGTVAGAVIGAKIGRDMDETDRACIGHALELTGDKKVVTWASADKRRTYRLTPLRGFEQQGVNCREFDLRVTTDGGKQTNRVKACPGRDGTWRIVG